MVNYKDTPEQPSVFVAVAAQSMSMMTMATLVSRDNQIRDCPRTFPVIFHGDFFGPNLGHFIPKKNKKCHKLQKNGDFQNK